MVKKQDDYDNPWNKVISLYFPAFMNFYDPKQLDWLFRQAVTIEFLAEFEALIAQAQANLEPYILD